MNKSEKHNKKSSDPEWMRCFFYIRNEKKKGRCLSLKWMITPKPLVKLGIQKLLRNIKHA